MDSLLPHLFRTEYQKIIAVLSNHFGLEHIEIAEDIAGDTFLTASEIWVTKGLPENPVAWLYTVAKNKAKDYLKRNQLFLTKVKPQLLVSDTKNLVTELDLTCENITDSQLRMLFAICHPAISPEAQISLALRVLCGFGIEEIANAFLTNKETINKRLQRAKEKLRSEKIMMELPGTAILHLRLQSVLTTLYLLFNEGYFSISGDTSLKKDLCLEAMRLTHLLTENKQTNQPQANALLALMCFQSSRFEARSAISGEAILYEEQDTSLWNQELINRGLYYLVQASGEQPPSTYYLEACIAYWHTQKADTREKWQQVLNVYNLLLQTTYSPLAALNRAFVLSKVQGAEAAITEAEKLELNGHPLYHSLLGDLYMTIDRSKACQHLEQALMLTKSNADKDLLIHKIEKCKKSSPSFI